MENEDVAAGGRWVREVGLCPVSAVLCALCNGLADGFPVGALCPAGHLVRGRADGWTCAPREQPGDLEFRPAHCVSG